MKNAIIFLTIFSLALIGCSSQEKLEGDSIKCFFGEKRCESAAIEGETIRANFYFDWKKTEVYIHDIDSICEIKSIKYGALKMWGNKEMNEIELLCPNSDIIRMSEDNPIIVNFTESYVDTRFGGDVLKGSKLLVFYD